MIKLSFEKTEDLIKKIKILESSISNDPSLPILKNVKMIADNEKIEFSTTNINISTSVMIKSNIKQSGSAVLSIQILSSFLDKSKNNEIISIEEKESNETKNLTVKYGKSKINLNLLDPKLYPILKDDLDSSNFIEIDASLILEMINKTKFSICQDQNRFNLHGILIHSEMIDGKNYFLVVTSDGHRLSVSKKQIEENYSFPKVIIPGQSVAHLIKFLSLNKNEKIKITCSSKKIFAECESTKISSKLVDAEFPNYKQVIPKNNNKILSVDRNNIKNALDKICIMQKYGSTKGVNIEINEKVMKLSIVTEDGDTLSDEIECLFNSEKMNIYCNPRYLSEIVSAIEDDNISLHLDKPESPFIIQGDSMNPIYILLPLRS